MSSTNYGETKIRDIQYRLARAGLFMRQLRLNVKRKPKNVKYKPQQDNDIINDPRHS